jgi:hypothetical protein
VIASTMPLGSVGYEAEVGVNGERLIWLPSALSIGSSRCAGQL